MDAIRARLGRHALSCRWRWWPFLAAATRTIPTQPTIETTPAVAAAAGRGGVHAGQHRLPPDLRRRDRPPRLLLGARRPRSGRGSRRPPVAPAQRRWGPCLRARHRQPGLLLGRQLLGPARRRHHDQPDHAGRGVRRASLPVGSGGRHPYLRRDVRGPGLLLGRQLRGADRRQLDRQPPPAAGPGGGPSSPSVRSWRAGRTPAA